MNNPKDDIKYLSQTMKVLHNDHFNFLYLNKKNKIIPKDDLHNENEDYVQPYTREILKDAMKHNATSLILAHNHTSGDPTPSSDDIKFTEHIYHGALFLDIALHDHIIIGDNNYYSFSEKGMIEEFYKKTKMS